MIWGSFHPSIMPIREPPAAFLRGLVVLNGNQQKNLRTGRDELPGRIVSVFFSFFFSLKNIFPCFCWEWQQASQLSFGNYLSKRLRFPLSPSKKFVDPRPPNANRNRWRLTASSMKPALKGPWRAFTMLFTFHTKQKQLKTMTEAAHTSARHLRKCFFLAGVILICFVKK